MGSVAVGRFRTKQCEEEAAAPHKLQPKGPCQQGLNRDRFLVGAHVAQPPLVLLLVLRRGVGADAFLGRPVHELLVKVVGVGVDARVEGVGVSRGGPPREGRAGLRGAEGEGQQAGRVLLLGPLAVRAAAGGRRVPSLPGAGLQTARGAGQLVGAAGGGGGGGGRRGRGGGGLLLGRGARGGRRQEVRVEGVQLGHVAVEVLLADVQAGQQALLRRPALPVAVPVLPHAVDGPRLLRSPPGRPGLSRAPWRRRRRRHPRRPLGAAVRRQHGRQQKRLRVLLGRLELGVGVVPGLRLQPDGHGHQLGGGEGGQEAGQAAVTLLPLGLSLAEPGLSLAEPGAAAAAGGPGAQRVHLDGLRRVAVAAGDDGHGLAVRDLAAPFPRPGPVLAAVVHRDGLQARPRPSPLQVMRPSVRHGPGRPVAQAARGRGGAGGGGGCRGTGNEREGVVPEKDVFRVVGVVDEVGLALVVSLGWKVGRMEVIVGLGFLRNRRQGWSDVRVGYTRGEGNKDHWTVCRLFKPNPFLSFDHGIYNTYG